MCFFFFFKQKTAYEMRISDWSSDVCSSDLGGAALAREAGGLAKGLPPRFNRLREQPLHETAQTKEGAVFLEAFAAALLDKIGRILWLDTKIGRASCRERVCQYV